MKKYSVTLITDSRDASASNKCLHNVSYRSLILKIIFWAPYTITHAVFRGSTDFWKKPFLGHPKVKLSLDGWMKWMGWIMRVRAVASPLSSSQSLPVLPTTTKWSKTVTTLPANWYQVSHKLPLALNIDTLMIIEWCWISTTDCSRFMCFFRWN